MKRKLFAATLHGALATLTGAWLLGGDMGLNAVWAQETEAEPADAAEDAEAKDGEPKKDPFEIPTGGADEIQKFMHDLTQAKAEGSTDEEQKAYASKVLHTMVTAADRLMKAKPSKEQLTEAHQFKIMALQLLSRFEGEEMEKELSKAIAAARNDPRPEVASIGWQMFVQQETSRWDVLDDADKNKFKKVIVARVKDNDAPLSVSIVRAIATSLDRVDDDFVAGLLKETLPVFAKSKNAKVKKALADASLEGMLRRITLLGNPMEITGTLLDGEEVDWKSYRGKVVLVDFWASWCGPCRAEVPNVLEMYAAYHDKGFDVLGVSLDNTPEDARQAIEEMQLPWPSIFPKEESARGWANPLAEYYGITGIPTAILVGKDGKVVHMEARGDELRQQLREILGDPIEPKADESEEKEEAAS